MKEIKIQIPEGCEGIDEEKSNLSEGIIVFKKKKANPWRTEEHVTEGYYITPNSRVFAVTGLNSDEDDHNIFATKKQAKSALAMAQLSQIIANDPRFGGPITDEEWMDGTFKCGIYRISNTISKCAVLRAWDLLVFHTKEQRDLFLKENEDLIRQFYMLD